MVGQVLVGVVEQEDIENLKLLYLLIQQVLNVVMELQETDLLLLLEHTQL